MNYRCPHCGGTFASPTAGTVRCPLCEGEVFVAPADPEGTAWDRERSGGWAEAFVHDVRDAIADPLRYFERVGAGQGWVRPWVFAIIISVIVFLIAAAYQAGFQALALQGPFGGLFSSAFEPFTILSVPFAIAAMAFAAVIGIPIATTGALLLQALLLHFCLMLLGAARRSFEATFRVVCYSMGPQLFQIVPLVGGLVAWGWQMVLSIIGLKVVHDTSYGRATLAVFLPAIACCGAVILLAVAISGWTFAAILATLKAGG